MAFMSLLLNYIKTLEKAQAGFCKVKRILLKYNLFYGDIMKINVNDTTLYYEIFGKGEPLLLLHGNGEDHHIFDVLVKKLKEKYTVYAIDSRNHGESEKTSDFSYTTMMEDVNAFVEALSLAPVYIIGFSDGAIISLLLSMKYPKVIQKMLLLGVNLKPEDFTDESYEYIKDVYLKTKDSLYRLMLTEPQIEISDVKLVNTPSLLMAGEKDIFKESSFVAVANAMPNARLKVWEGHDHSDYVDGKDLIYAEALAFFEE